MNKIMNQRLKKSYRIKTKIMGLFNERLVGIIFNKRITFCLGMFLKRGLELNP